MSEVTARVVEDCDYYHPDCCPSDETGDTPVAMTDDDLRRYVGDIYYEGCQLVINGHLTDRAELLSLELLP